MERLHLVAGRRACHHCWSGRPALGAVGRHSVRHCSAFFNCGCREYDRLVAGCVPRLRATRLDQECPCPAPADALQQLLDTHVPGELKPLFSTRNSLLHRIQQRIGREHTFTGRCRNELRMPLIAVKTHIQSARLAGGGGGGETGLAFEHAKQGLLRL